MDIDNDTTCGAEGCGHLASAHADTDDGANNGACSTEGCECSAMSAGSSSDDGDAAARTIQLAGGGTVTLSDDLGLSAEQIGAFVADLEAAFRPLPDGACFRTGCTHLTGAHLDLQDGTGTGKCTVTGCTCRAFMPQGSPGEPALPEPGITAAAADGEPGEPGDEPPPPETDEVTETGYPFRALLVQEGVDTSDGRYIEPMATRWRTPPLSLAWQDKTEHGGMADTAAVNIGRIDVITREPGEVPGTFDIWGTGFLDDEDPVAVIAAHKIQEKFLRGVSVDMAVHAAEVEITAVDEDGWPIGERLIMTDCEIGMATVTSFAAFGDCQIELTGEGPSEAESSIGFELPEVGDRIPILADGAERPESFTWQWAESEHVEERAGMTLLASGGPMSPPREWFEQPAFAPAELIEIPPHLCGGRRGVRACPLTITDDGHVYGHVASWHVDHTAMNGKHIKAPRTAGYELFNNRGVLRCADGSDVPVGNITLDGGHADLRLDWRSALRHYDDTRSAVIDCRVGTDEHGIWLAGALRPDVDELTLRRLRAASISGDWRPLGGRHEFIAACSVNTAGFPTLRAALAASAAPQGEEEGLVALVAAGALPTRPETTAESLLAKATAELAHARREREAERLLRTIGG